MMLLRWSSHLVHREVLERPANEQARITTPRAAGHAFLKHLLLDRPKRANHPILST